MKIMPKKLLPTIALFNIYALEIKLAELHRSVQEADERRGGVQNYTKRGRQ